MKSTTMMEVREAWKDARRKFIQREVVGGSLRA
jgi:hypothetical protein